ncbi:MAG: hypothetical protein A3J38_06065 [Gammaproteobacteria bacterium RIFCSPHIGHO2_12_FULL_45_9]|nr:MAG: hypothetical protein A3J38_06065 [Gammaproteobacteria bacterium RIFCSPHIGHO2_12_FULL_45_9]
MQQGYSHIKPCSMAFALGLVFAIGTLAMGWYSAVTGRADVMVQAMGTMYIGFGPTFLGAVIGAIWAFIEGLVFGYLLSFFYNRCLDRACCKKGSKCSTDESCGSSKCDTKKHNHKH